MRTRAKLFQSPRSGKFVSDVRFSTMDGQQWTSFNPLDRGNLYQIKAGYEPVISKIKDRFQSPKSGKFVSDGF